MQENNTLPLGKGYLYLTKQVEFAASHRLYNHELSDKENRELYGKCANDFGHGHNYVLEATFRGKVDVEKGLVAHYKELKAILQEIVVTPMDHHNLNEDVACMKGILPSSENIVLVIWNELARALQGQSYTLFKLKLASTPRNWVEYYGPDHD